MPISDTSSPPTKFCPACALDLPLDSFGFRVHGKPARRSRCRGCYNGYMADYRLLRRAKSIGKVLSAIKRSTDLSRTEALAKSAMQKFGGLDGFANEWRDQYEATTPGSATAFKMLSAILDLAVAVDASQRLPVAVQSPPLSTPARKVPVNVGNGSDYDMSGYITEEDLQRELTKMMERSGRETLQPAPGQHADLTHGHAIAAPTTIRSAPPPTGALRS